MLRNQGEAVPVKRRSLSSAVVVGVVCCLSAASCVALKNREPLLRKLTAEVKASAPKPTRPADLSDGPLRITLEEAVFQALGNNRALSVQRLEPSILRTFEEQERAVFDPVASADIAGSRTKTETTAGVKVRGSSTGGGAGVSARLPTGTDIAVGATTERTWSDTTTEQHATRAGITVTQALLRGRGLGPNLADLRQARLDTRLSEYELRGFAQALVAEVEATYWDYVLARRQVEIFEESLKLAEQQMQETRQRIDVGGLAETELAAAQAETALRREALINAHSRVDSLRVRLIRLIRPGALKDAARIVLPESKPAVPDTPLSPVDEHLHLASRMRPDLNQSRLLVQRDDLELVRTRNGLLPQMDLFVSLGATGYARSFGRSARDMRGDGYDVAAGIAFEFPIVNRDARARHTRATLTRHQREESLRNVEDLVREDVDLSHIEVRRTREQVDATTATRRFQEEKLRAEMAKFSVGKSTAILVATAQRDLVASQVAAVAAVTDHLKALTNLYLLDGSLLERRGISAPGREPAAANAWKRPADD